MRNVDFPSDVVFVSTDDIRELTRVFGTCGSGMVWGQHHIGHDEKSIVFARGNHIVRFIPNTLIYVNVFGRKTLLGRFSQSRPEIIRMGSLT